jgi:asparagine synthase (glutamine-hydrolysing)
MCGILGNFGFIEHGDFNNHLREVDEPLARRGPDQINHIDLQNFLATHSRLIIHGSKDDGLQPICFKNLAILFNGNLYNKNALKLDLELQGYSFKGISDTEVVAIAIYHWGNKAFKKFNGFFSIACFNRDKKSLTLARDRLGQKPLYYSKNARSVFFGSTENFVPKKFRGNMRKESFIDFITFGFIPAPNTMYENMFSVMPGSFIEFSFVNEKVATHGSTLFWKPIITNEITDLNLATEAMSDAIIRSVKEGMDSSVDVACLFSGGVDSSLILSNAKQINEEIAAITADFGAGDDAKLRSRSLAEFLGHQNHVIREISNDDVEGSLKIIAKICDSPFDDTSIIPSNIVFESVKRSGYSVALTGDGADELFCGYSSFANLSKLEKFLDPKFDPLIRLPGKIFATPISKYKSIDLTRLFLSEEDLLIDLSCNGFKKREWADLIDTDYDPFQHLHNILNELDGLRPLDKFRILNLRFKLPYQMLFKVDRASMYNSVEARPLFLNNRIIDTALSISSSVMMQNGPKTILKEIYKSQLNHSGWSLPKTGFGWRTKSYKEIFSESDNDYLKAKTGINGFSLLKNRKRHHKRGYYGLYSFASWFQEHC